ncbi:conserved membrane hypothetical protein [Tenacibaculum amylolyticum]
MLKLIKSLLKDKAIYIAISITIIIAILSLIKVGSQPIYIKYLDKIEHTTAYFVLTFFWLLAFFKKEKIRTIIIVLSISYGILLEVLQGTITTYRTFDYVDMIANTLGVLIAFLVFKIIEKKQFNLLNSL